MAHESCPGIKLNIKFVLGVALLALAVESMCLNNENDLISECLRESGANPILVGGLKGGNFSIKDFKSQCFLKCMFQRIGILDMVGNFNENVAREVMVNVTNQVVVNQAIDMCKDLKGQCLCETSFKIYECFYNLTHQLDDVPFQ